MRRHRTTALGTLLAIATLWLVACGEDGVMLSTDTTAEPDTSETPDVIAVEEPVAGVDPVSCSQCHMSRTRIDKDLELDPVPEPPPVSTESEGEG